jgi:hypothetical protein
VKFKKSVGKAVLEGVKQHFLELNSQRHHSWAPGIGFYAQAARGTKLEITEEGFDVVVNKAGLRQRIDGGTITAGKGISCATGQATKYLAIPALAEAYGRSPCLFGGLRFVKFGASPDAPAALVESAPKSLRWAVSGRKVKSLLKQGNQQGAFGRRVFYWLKKSVTQKPDASVLPDLSMLETVAIDAADKFSGTLPS